MQSQETSKQAYWPQLSKLLLPFLTWLLLLLAASNPVWIDKAIPLKQQGRNLFLAVDISGSMQTKDMQYRGENVSRLATIKAIAKQFIKERPVDRFGLILFGSKAYLQTPLTHDHKTISNMLDDATPGLAGTRTAIGDAIALAIKRLKDNRHHNNVLILLTDGQNNAGHVLPTEAAKLAAQQKIKIYTIGLGANQLLVPTLFGNRTINPSADLDASMLKQIAQLTGGEFFRATSPAELQATYQSIDKLEPSPSKGLILHPRKTLFYWPLMIGLLISIWLALQALLSKPADWSKETI